jgi:hypothetical protein
VYTAPLMDVNLCETKTTSVQKLGKREALLG